jgi:single-stranded DNA-binding protein
MTGDRLAEVCGQFLSRGYLVVVKVHVQTRQWDDDASSCSESQQCPSVGVCSIPRM